MAGARHNRPFTIGRALPISEGVYVHVRDDAVAARSADFPQARKRGFTDHYNAGRQCQRIDIVVKDELKDLMHAALQRAAEKISAALARFVKCASC